VRIAQQYADKLDLFFNMGDDYYSGGSERRGKKKDKFKRKKLHPYKRGGKWRAQEMAKK